MGKLHCFEIERWDLFRDLNLFIFIFFNIIIYFGSFRLLP